MAEVTPTPAKTRVSEAIARPVRTAAQATPAWVLTELVDAWFYDMDERQFGAAVLALTLLFGWVQALLENKRGSGFFLRDVPPKDSTVAGE